MSKFFRIFGFCLVAASIFAACESDDNKMARIQVSMIDAPADYESVLIDVVDVQINSDGWQSLDGVEKKVYDLLTLTNGEEAILGEIELPEGQLQEVRLILGDNNKLGLNGEELDLDTPSGSQSGLKIKIHTQIEGGVTYKLVLDFDAAKSIVKAGNSGKYNLKPVIRAEMEALTGAIKGVVDPADIESVVYAIIDTDSISTYPNDEGQFLIRALQSETYRVVAIPSQESAFTKASLDEVIVNTGEVTVLDTIRFQNNPL